MGRPFPFWCHLYASDLMSCLHKQEPKLPCAAKYSPRPWQERGAVRAMAYPPRKPGKISLPASWWSILLLTQDRAGDGPRRRFFMDPEEDFYRFCSGPKASRPSAEKETSTEPTGARLPRRFLVGRTRRFSNRPVGMSIWSSSDCSPLEMGR